MRLLHTLLFTVLIAACSSKKDTTALAEVPDSQPDTVVVMMEPQSEEDSLAVYFEKTPCFGRCPVFKIHVYDSGFATYEGLNFAELMGLYSYRFSKKDLEKIYEMARAIDYFQLKSSYDDPRISDLPSVISRINWDGQSHEVTARSGVPAELRAFHENLGVMLREKDWQTYSLR